MTLRAKNNYLVAAGDVARGLVRSFPMVLFVGRWPLAVACLLACFVEPKIGLAGLSGALLANLWALVLGLPRTQIRSGLLGLNGLLVGLALGAWYGLGLQVLVLLLAASLAVVVIAAGLNYFLGGLYNLPSMSLSFVLVATLVYLAGRGVIGVTPAGVAAPLWDLGPGWLPLWLTEYCRSLAAIFFQSSILSGAIILLGLLLTSRLMVFLTILGFAVGKAFGWALGVDFEALSPQVWGFNLLLTAVAVGGIFFIPSPRAFVAAGLATVFSGVFSLSLGSMLSGSQGLVLAWPFNLTVLAFLVAARSRTGVAGPQAVDFVPDTPERNLEYHLVRLRRYSGFSVPVFRLPLSGRWRIEQGPDGEVTHSGDWSHAWDFVGVGYDDRASRGDGSQVEHHLAYGEPVLAGAGGRVVRVIDGVPDNPVGHENLDQRWGNVVVLWHAGEVYSVYAHLIPGSIVVAEGQWVVAGQHLGQLGNSGRSSFPHLHFHCQRSPEVGAPTALCEFVNYVEPLDGVRRYVFTGSPRTGTMVEEPTPSADFTAAFRLSLGKSLEMGVMESGRERAETWTVESDLISGAFLFEQSSGAKLFFSSDWHSFFVTDYIGPPSGGLYAFYLAASRVPFSFDSAVSWTDVLPAKVLVGRMLGFGLELSRPFFDPLEVRAEKRFVSPRSVGDSEMAFGVASELTLTRRGVRGGNDWGARHLLRAEAWFCPRMGPILIRVNGPGDRILEVRAEGSARE